MGASDSEPSASRRNHRVLVVDDCIDNAEMMTEALSHFGYETALAHDGRAALSVAQQFQPHVVVLDIELPGMNGIELTRQLRAQHGPELTVIAISGYASARYGEEAAAAGVQHYFMKPVELGKLEDLLLTILVRAQKNA
jgi:CheY-like chemotaxis protein